MKKIINYAIWCVLFTILITIYAIQERYNIIMAMDILMLFMNFGLMCIAIKDYKTNKKGK